MDFYVVPQSMDPCESATANSTVGSSNTGDADLYGEALVFVTNPLSNTVTVVNTKTGSAESPIDVGQRPMKIDINPQGTMAYVSNYLSNDVSVIDIARREVVSTIKVGIHPYGIAVTPDGKRVYVANQFTNNLSVIDVDPKSGGFDHVVANVPVGTNPNDVEITGDAGLVLVAGDFGLEIINGNPDDEKYNCAVANVASGTKTTEVEVTGDAGLAIVATEDNHLLVINLHPEDGDYTDAVVANVPAGTDVSNIQVSGDAIFVYVSAPDSDLVQMYRIGYGASATPNGSTSGAFTLVRHSTITGVENPDAMVIDPYAINLFVVNDGPVTAGNREITTITLCCGPVDPAKTISDLIATIQDLNINQSIKDDLVFRLNEVLRNLAAGKNKTAMNNLHTFTNKINSLINSRKITREQGQPLIDAANKLKDQISLLPLNKSVSSETFESVTLNESGLGVIYPNPSGNSFNIEYEISESDDLAGKVAIRILDMNGVIVNTLLDQAVHTGRYSLIWNGTADNGTPVSGGTYFVHFRAGKIEKVKMIILIK
jgi:YVTN family beta-propeller protein